MPHPDPPSVEPITRSFTRGSLGAVLLVFSAFSALGGWGCSDADIRPVDDDDDDASPTNGPPTARIEEPEQNTRSDQGEEVPFRGVVSDPESEGTALEVSWTSSIDGVLREDGHSADGVDAFSVTTLSPGLHGITLRVTDPEGAVGSDVVELEVVANLPPTIRVVEPTEGDRLRADLPFSLVAEVSDAEDTPQELRVLWTVDGAPLSDELVPDPGGRTTAEAALDEGPRVLLATVTDTSGASATQVLSLEVAPAYVEGGPCEDEPPAVLPTCAAATGIFFSIIDAGTGAAIHRIDMDGSNLTQIHASVADDLEYHALTDTLFWVRSDAVLERGPASGGAIELLHGALPYAYGIALDPFARRVYWTNQVGTPKMQRTCLWGGSVVDVLPTLGPGGNCCAIGTDIDFEGGHIYWMDGYYGGPVSRMNLDGTGVVGLYSTPGIGNGVAVDPRGSKLYWSEYGNSPGQDAVRRANLDGSNVETLLTSIDGLATPQHIAVDPAAGKLYWADLDATVKVGRSNLDGSGVEALYTGPGEVRAIALEREHPCR